MNTFIDPEAELAGLELMVNCRKWMDQQLLASGMTQEEIQALVEEAMEGIFVNGVPVRKPS